MQAASLLSDTGRV